MREGVVSRSLSPEIARPKDLGVYPVCPSAPLKKSILFDANSVSGTSAFGLTPELREFA